MTAKETQEPETEETKEPEQEETKAVVVSEPDVIATVPDVNVEPISQNQFRKRYPNKSRSQIREMYQEYLRTGIFPQEQEEINEG